MIFDNVYPMTYVHTYFHCRLSIFCILFDRTRTEDPDDCKLGQGY